MTTDKLLMMSICGVFIICLSFNSSAYADYVNNVEVHQEPNTVHSDNPMIQNVGYDKQKLVMVRTHFVVGNDLDLTEPDTTTIIVAMEYDMISKNNTIWEKGCCAIGFSDIPYNTPLNFTDSYEMKNKIFFSFVKENQDGVSATTPHNGDTWWHLMGTPFYMSFNNHENEMSVKQVIYYLDGNQIKTSSTMTKICAEQCSIDNSQKRESGT